MPHQKRDERSYLVLEDGKISKTKNKHITVTYGDFVAYYTEEKSWAVGQFLADQSEVPEGIVRLRRMDTPHRDMASKRPREYSWRYHWDSERGRSALSSGTGPDAEPFKKPGVKNVGKLWPTHIDVGQTDIIGIVHLNEDNTINTEAWNKIVAAADTRRIGAAELFVRSIHLTGKLTQ